MTPTDMALVQRWMETQDAEAFHEIVRRHSAMVYATCRRVLGNAADAEDVAQDCFLKLAQARSPMTANGVYLIYKYYAGRVLFALYK